jgi:hypothetical protein
MMLWLLATLSVRNHFMGNRAPAQGCQSSGQLHARAVLVSPPTTAHDPRTAVTTDTEERSANPRTGHTPAENPELRHNTHKENNA